MTANQRIVARAIIFGPRGCLLQHKHQPARGDYYGLPGGAKEPGETLIEALQRESLEEIGTDLLSPRLAAVVDYRRRDTAGVVTDRVECLFRASLPESYEPVNGPHPDRNQRGVVWMPIDDIATAPFSPSYLQRVILRLASEATESLGYAGSFTEEDTI